MKVLFVDDEVDLLEIAVGFFEDENIQLDTSSNLDEAISKIKSNHYDLIITDANMPSGSGISLIKAARNDLHYKGKILLATGELEKPEWKNEAGYDKAISKPMDFPSLIELIKSLVG